MGISLALIARKSVMAGVRPRWVELTLWTMVSGMGNSSGFLIAFEILLKGYG